MMTPLPVLLLILCLGMHVVHPFVNDGDQLTELDQYVRQVDDVYGWTSFNESFTVNASYTAHFYNLTSLKYLTPNMTNRHFWHHTIVYIVPVNLSSSCDHAFVWFTWGKNQKPWTPDAENDVDIAVISQVAMNTGCPAAAVYEIPNQEICFYDIPGESYCDDEDGAIAYTFNRFLYKNHSPEWLLLFPMTKAGVRSMDAVTEISSKEFGLNIQRFTVSGASKRGWTTWLVGAVDTLISKRVVSVVPVVLDALRFDSFLHRMWQAYQGFTLVLGPYWKMGLTNATALPIFQEWANLIDPYRYRSRMTYPKFTVNAVGDEFQLLDDQAQWAHDMPQEMKTILIKDADHLLLTNFGLVLQAVTSFVQSVVFNLTRPSYTWAVDNSTGQITVWTSEEPAKVEFVYTTVNTKRRDFRDIVLEEDPCLIHVMGGCVRFLWWSSVEAVSINKTTYTTLATVPIESWTGFYLQITFDTPRPGVMKDYVFASPASVLPLGYPFPDCSGSQCYGQLV